MPEIPWFTSEEIPDRADMLAPRGYIKKPLSAYAPQIPTLPDEVTLNTTVTLVGNHIIANNSEDLNIEVLAKVTMLDASYDQLNRLWCAYIEDGQGKLFWYDAALADYTTFEFGECDTVFLFMDDVRYYVPATSSSTVFLIYVRDQVIYYRTQAERFLEEYIIGNLAEGEILKGAGMNEKYRLQLVIETPEVTQLTVGDPYTLQYTIGQQDVMIGTEPVIGEHTYHGY
jgi:hypothetical protein